MLYTYGMLDHTQIWCRAWGNTWMMLYGICENWGKACLQTQEATSSYSALPWSIACSSLWVALPVVVVLNGVSDCKSHTALNQFPRLGHCLPWHMLWFLTFYSLSFLTYIPFFTFPDLCSDPWPPWPLTLRYYFPFSLCTSPCLSFLVFRPLIRNLYINSCRHSCTSV